MGSIQPFAGSLICTQSPNCVCMVAGSSGGRRREDLHGCDERRADEPDGARARGVRVVHSHAASGAGALRAGAAVLARLSVRGPAAGADGAGDVLLGLRMSRDFLLPGLPIPDSLDEKLLPSAIFALLAVLLLCCGASAKTVTPNTLIPTKMVAPLLTIGTLGPQCVVHPTATAGLMARARLCRR
jgi:hypothetical protein